MIVTDPPGWPEEPSPLFDSLRTGEIVTLLSIVFEDEDVFRGEPLFVEVGKELSSLRCHLDL